MQILVDENVPAFDHFAGLGAMRRMPGRNIGRDSLADVEALIVRSVTRIDTELLRGTPVRFVASATAGIDHVDTRALEQLGIAFAHAPGANASSVVDYVLAALATLFPSRAMLQGKRIGIIGCGNVGSRLLRRLQALPLECRVCDPFLPADSVPGLCSLSEVLDADVLSLHTPLTDNGPYPTRHLLDATRLEKLRPGAVLINTARGAVIDTQALQDVLGHRDDLQLVLDVWETEPEVDSLLLRRARLMTPHIAGYAWDGKLRGSEMVYRALCDFLRREAQWTPPPPAAAIDLGELAVDREADLPQALLRQAYPVQDESEIFKNTVLAGMTQSAGVFDAARRHYPQRREMSSRPLLNWAGLTAPTLAVLRQLGFTLGGDTGQ